ncbi:hypothetical protein BKA65DRAFT_560435 [Rhexocercosporidium sp. MPI-PUGE-AT-0058]|nr:hypothetical protein BKA65DRAFT_560435 [Rhexocercosporidium sp. MPI-PUGE-AT-0058]
MFGARKADAMQLLERGKLNAEMENPERYAVATTWLISFEQIQKVNPLAAEYMKFIATIKDNDIPKDILPEIEWNEMTLDQEEAISTLVGFAFLKPHPEDRLYDMHRLIHLVLQSWLEMTNESSIWTERAILRLTDLIPDGGHEDREKWTEYLPHGLEDWQLPVDPWIIQLAERPYREALSLRKKVLGEEHPQTLTSMNNLALLFHSQGQ